MKKGARLAHNVIYHRVLVLQTTLILMLAAELLYAFSHFVTQNQNIKKACTQGSIFNTWANFRCFIKDILKPNWLFFFFVCKCVVVRNTVNDSYYSRCHCFIHTQAPAILSTFAFAPSVQISTQKKRNNNIFVFI